MGDPFEYLQNDEVIPGGAQNLPGTESYVPPQGIPRPPRLRRGSFIQHAIEWLKNPFSRTIFSADFGQVRFITNSTTQQLIFEPEIKRQYLIIQNKSTSAIFVGFGQKANSGTGFEIAAGGSYEPLIAPINSIYIVGNQVGGQQVVVAIQGLV